MKRKVEFDGLFILDIANNHMGDVKHGIQTIREVWKECKNFKFNFAFKLQYRDLDTFIHPEFKGNKDIKYVKRFEETRLTKNEFQAIKNEIDKTGCFSICTPFDEKSVDLIEEQNFDIIKIGSCSFTDWPLLERIARTDLPIIASTAGASLEEIDRVVIFFQHRDKQFCLMHCVGEYPTKRENLQLNQIDLLIKRYPGVTVGFSTHEDPDNLDSVQIAIAKGARVFERHVALQSKKYPGNAYSSTPVQVQRWLQAASGAYQMCGVEGERYPISEKESNDLRGLKRGVFAKAGLKKGDKLTAENIFYAIPCQQDQLVANNISKYIEYELKKDLKANQAVYAADVNIKDLRGKVLAITKGLKEIILKSHIALPDTIDLELSHHFGIDRFQEWGAAILNCINREYCKKLIILLPGQKHPVHYHEKKEESFHVLYGNMEVRLGKENKMLKAGDLLTVERGVNHSFLSQEGVIFEEISTTHYKNDSFYEDNSIMKNKERKTEMTFRTDWLYEPIK